MINKIARLFVSLLLGIGMIWALLGVFTISPIKAQESLIDAGQETAVNSLVSRLQQIVPDNSQTPEQALEASYQRILAAGAYNFTADSEQTLLPRPLPSMIGQTNQRVDMHVEGEVTLPDYSVLSVSLDGNGLDPTPVSIIQEGVNSYLLREGEKVLVENPAGLTSPTGDYLSYLAAAENVRLCESDATPFATAVACYTYAINGPKYAEHVRQQMQAQLAKTPGAAALDVNVDVSPVIKQISGQGTVWLDDNGLPLRQKIDMHMPEADDRYDADVRMVIDYHFDAEAVAAALAANSSFVASILPPVEKVVEAVGEGLPYLFIFGFFLTITTLLLILRRRRWIYSFIAIFLTIAFLTTPLLQVINIDLFYRHVYAADSAESFANTFVAAQAERAEDAPVHTESLAAQSLTASAQAFQPDVYCGKGGNGDRDGDGLADDAEYCLGTNPNLKDSDADGIDDGLEVAGFEYGRTVTQTWHSNPMNPDTNGDGVTDNSEWAQAGGGLAINWDIDADGIPNLYDVDDDGDGVADSRDLSPASFTKYISENNSVPAPFPFFSFPTITFPIYQKETITETTGLNITGRYNGYVYVDLQVQPQNLDHLLYGATPLDWGYDNKGQIQEHNNAADEDVRLIPLLIVETNLVPDDELAEGYNVTPYHDTDGDGYHEMMLPLFRVGQEGGVEAFQAHMAYGPSTLNNLGEDGVHWRNARIIWLVRGTFDVENDDGSLTEQSMSLHTYEEPATRITGWEVTKSGPFQSAIIGTPSMPNDDRALFQMAFGLSGSFLANQQPNLDEINARFSGANTPVEQKWGITTTVAIDLPAVDYAHSDEGLADLNNRIKTFLSDHYAWDTPNTILIAYELRAGSANLDDLGQMEAGFSASVNLPKISMRTQRSIHMNMRDGWDPISGGKLSLAVMQRVQPAAKAAIEDLSDQYPALTETELVALTQSMYATWENGRTRIVSLDGVDFVPSSGSDQALYEQIYLTPRDRYGDPDNISTLPGYLVEVGNFAQKGGGLLINGSQTWQYLQANASEAANMGFTMATVQFVQKANDALVTGLGGAPTFGENINWASLQAEVGKDWYETDDYNNTKQAVTDGLNMFSVVGGVAEAAKGIAGAAKSGVKITSAITKAAKFMDVAGKVVGVAALVIDVGLSIATFILNGDFSGQAIALLIAQIVVAVLMFALGTIPPWIGTVIAVLLAIFDLVLSFCKACRDFLGLDSISGWFTKNLASYFYREEPRTELQDYSFKERDTALADEEMGYVIGNRFIISDTFRGIMKVSGTKGFDLSAVKNGAIMGGGFGALVALSDQVDVIGMIFGGPSNKENLSNSWICGEFTVQKGLQATTTTCPDKSADYNLDEIPSDALYWTYENPMHTTVTLNRAVHDFEILLSTKVVAQSVWDASVPAPPVIIPIPLGRIHWTKERTLTLPNDLSSDNQKQWQTTPIYLDVLPGTVEAFWNWGQTEPIITNHDPDGDGMTTQAEITAWLGSSSYAEFKSFFSSVLYSQYGNNTSSDLDRFLANWDLLETISVSQIPAFCSTYPSLSGLCNVNSSPPWLTPDYDGDGLSDKFEFDQNGALGTNAFVYDTDGDGLSDGFEYQIGTRIDDKDSDVDGLSDDVEVYHPTSSDTWDGGWDIELPAYGPVGPNGRSLITVRVFSDPLNADTDGDGLSDFAEKQNGTSPTAFNRAPRVELTGQPTAVSPQGISAVYVKPGDLITLSTRLEVYPPYVVTTTMDLNLPGGAFGFPATTALNGSRWVANTGVTFNPRWNFANDVLQPWEYLYATTTSSVAYPSSSLVTTATLSLPFGGEGQVQEAAQRIVVDVENPRFGWMTPAGGELIGGGISHYVVGGTSSDQTTWVKQLTLNMPGETAAITDTESFSPWAYTWELPTDGIYTLSGTSTDFVGHTSAQDSVEVMIDNSAPTVDVDLQDGAVYGPPQDSSVITITLSGSASENLSGLTRVQISTDGGPWREVWTLNTATESNTTFTDFTANFQDRATSATWDAVWTLPNVETVQGYHNLRVRAFDLAGNWPTSLERNIIIDVLPPTDELVNRAYIYEFPHVPANAPHTFDGVANDVGNVPQPSRPTELVGGVDSIDDATIWLGLSDIHENDSGVNVAWIGDFNGDRRGDLLVGLPASADGAGRVVVVYGRSGNWPIPNNQEMLANASTSFMGLTGATIGGKIMPAGDVNGDGLADLLIGDPANNRVFLIFGKPTYFGGDLVLDGPQGSNWSVLVPPAGQTIGQYLGSAGDVNGDGYADLLIGATGAADMAYLIMGQSTAWWPSIPINTVAAARIDQAGTAMLTGLGDLDGDFRDEFALGINNQLYLFEGKGSYAPRAGTWLSLSSATDSLSSVDANPNAVGLGDVNGDHIDDFIYSNGSSQILSYGDENMQDGTWSTHAYNYGSGFLAAPGDVDNDGLNDILIGNGTDAYLIAGSNIAATQSTISGVSAAASAPYPAGADLNSDGSSDLLLVPTAAGSHAAATTSANSIADLPPTWVPQLPEQTLSTFVGDTTWPPVDYADGYVNADGVCHSLAPCYTTIQSAVDAWNDDDLIIVQPGVYAPFVIDGYSHSYNRITIRGTDPDAVIIDANGSSYAARINMATGVRLENLTLRNASYGVQLDSAGINGHETPSYRTVLDHLLIYDTTTHDVYMSRNSSVSVVNSTLARGSQQIGAYGSADPNIVVQWNAMDNSPWPIMDGGGAVTIDDVIYFERGGGNQAFGRYDAANDFWISPPWGPNNVYEDNSVIAAGSDDQVYLLGAPHWRDTSLPSDYDAVYAAGGNGVMYGKDSAGSAYYWDGNGWVSIPGSPSDIWEMAAHPVTGDLYVHDYILDEVLKWDGSSWTTLIETPFYFSDARMMEIGSDGTIYFGGNFSNLFRGDYNPTCSGQVIYANPDNTSIFNCQDLGEGAAVSALAADPTSNAVYIGGEFETEWGANNLTTINGGSINGVTGPVYGIDVDDEGTIYVAGEFTSTLSFSGSIDQPVPSGIASWAGSNWTTYPAVIEDMTWNWGNNIVATGGGEFYAYGLWEDTTNNIKARLIHWDGSSWELGNVYNATNNAAVWSMASSPQGVFISGHVTSIDMGDTSVSSSSWNFLLQSPFEVYSTTLNSWHTGIVGPPIQLGDGASMAGDDFGNLVVLVGGGRTDSFKYNIANGTWTRVGDMPHPVSASAMTLGENGDIYAITNGSSSFYKFSGSSWSAVGPTVSGVTIADGAALAYDSHFGTYYVLPGGNGNMMLRYNPAWGSSWEILPADRNTPAGVRPGAALVFIEGEDENKLYTPQGNYTGDTSTALWMYPLPMPNKVEFKDSIVYAQSGTSWLNYSDPLPEDFNFRVDEDSRFFGGTGWTPTNMGTLPTTTDVPFLDAARDVYRMGETGATYTIGYHIYTAPVTATTATGIQSAINSGANLVIVEPGIYEEDVYLVNGVEVVGTNPDWTIIRPLNNSTATALVRAEGSTGASFSRFTLDGENNGLDGFAATGNAAYVTLQRVRVFDTNTAIAIDGSGSDLEVAHATVAQNNNGLTATNCPSVDVRNTIFAYHTVSGLSHEACASVQLHTYNLYWANASDFGADADAGAAELFLDPNFVDPMDHDYRTLNFSPVIDAGNPTDPSPPGAGSRADIGYIEQGRVNFYVDDSYCEICINDGLTWQVDAFDNIQDALDAAEHALANLNPSFVDVPQLVVGVAPGTYSEQVTIPSHVLLFGSGAEDTILDAGASGTAVTFNSVTEAGLRHMTVLNADTGISISGASNLIDIQRNIIRNNVVGVAVNGRATAELEYNTLVNNQTGVIADEPGSWAAMMHNIVSGSDTGLIAGNSGQIFTDYNLFYNTVDMSGVNVGENDIVDQDPLFAGGGTPYRLSETSPALDAASPLATVPEGGGTVADLGYSELLAAPVTLLLGQEDLSTVMGNSGVASVEYGVAPAPDPTAPVTATLPSDWFPITLDTPGETLSYWALTYTPLDEGLYRFYSRATDMVGNQEEDELDWYDGSFVVDSTPPTVEWLSPFDGASLEAPLELRAQVSDYAAGEFSVDENDVYFELDGQRYPATWAAEPWAESASEPRVFRAWISPTLGTYTNVVAGAEDKAGNSATDSTMSFTLTAVSPQDTTPPTVTVSLPLPNSWVTHTVIFSGTATDLGSSIASVELSLDGGATWRPTTVSGDEWSITWEGPEELPMISFPAEVRATDRAGNTAVMPFQFSIDEVAPTGIIPVTFSMAEDSHFDVVADLEIYWQPPLDASGVISTFLAVDQITDTIPVDEVSGLTAVHSLDSNGDWYVHLGAIDAAGNAKIYHYGPWHVGLNEGLSFGSRQQSIIIDGYVDVANNEWRLDNEYLDDDERTFGSEVTYSPGGQQSFLTAWDANNYYLAWRGGQWTLDGELWIYLKAGGTGGNELIVPLASAPAATLPFAANYAIQITDPLTGTLYEYNGGWQVSAEEWTFAQGSTGDTEIRLPLFGTSDVETLAFGLGDDANVWAIFPATNPLIPVTTIASPAGLDAPAAEGDGWTSYQWADVTAVTNVAAGQPQAIALALNLDSPQAPQAPWGPGSTLEYVIEILNLEAETVSGQQLLLTATPDTALIHDGIVGATCGTTNPWDCTLDPLAPGLNVITLTTHLAANLSGLESVTMTAELTDSNIPPEMATVGSVTHQIDGVPPEVSVIAPPFVGLGSYSFAGIATDGDGVGVDYVEVRSQFGSWQRANGTELWTVDLTVSPFLQHGDEWQFEVRAADLLGQVSEPQVVTFTVDLLGPSVTFDSPTELSGSLNEILGIITDLPQSNEAADVQVQLDEGPWREAILFALNEETGEQSFLWTWNMPTEDGAAHTLRVQTVDTVGNPGSLSPAQNVWVDNVTPVLTVTEVLTQVAMQHYYPGAQIGAPVLSGSVMDGTAVDSVAVWVELPNGTSYVDTAVLNTNTWEYVPSLQTLGNYKLQVRATDTLGNQTQTTFYDLEVLAAPDAGPNTFYTPEDTPISFEPLLDDIDIDSETIFLDAVQDPANGSATISGETWIIYTPTLNFNGTDVFTYTASDGQFTDSATVTVTVLSVNDPPLISGSHNITATMDEDSGTLAFNFNGINVDDDTLTWTIDEGLGTAVISNTYGAGNLNADVAYTPELDFVGFDTFGVRLSDGQYTDEVTIVVTVDPVDDAPRAADDYLVIVPSESGKPINITVLDNDEEVDGQTLLLAGVDIPSKGSNAAVNGNVMRYTPNLALGETETVSYTVSDGGLTDTAVLHVKVVAGEVSGESGETVTASGLGENNSIDVTLTIPANVVAGNDQVTFVLRETAVTGNPPQGTKFAGLSFALEPYVDGVLMASPFVLNSPIILTIEYSDADVADIGRGDDELMLYTWTDNQWLPDGITLVERDTLHNRLVVSVAHLSEFALFGTDMIEIYLPMIVKP